MNIEMCYTPILGVYRRVRHLLPSRMGQHLALPVSVLVFDRIRKQYALV